MRLKRIMIGALVAGSLLGSAVGVGAASNAPGNGCGVGDNISGFASTTQSPLIGDFFSTLAQTGPGAVGQQVGTFQGTLPNCNGR